MCKLYQFFFLSHGFNRWSITIVEWIVGRFVGEYIGRNSFVLDAGKISINTTFDGCSDIVEIVDNQCVQILTGPYRINENVDGESNNGTDTYQNRTIYSGLKKSAGFITRYHYETEGYQEDSESILVWPHCRIEFQKICKESHGEDSSDYDHFFVISGQYGDLCYCKGQAGG